MEWNTINYVIHAISYSIGVLIVILTFVFANDMSLGIFGIWASLHALIWVVYYMIESKLDKVLRLEKEDAE